MKSVYKFLLGMSCMMTLGACSLFSGPRHYTLTEKDSGKTLHLNRGDTFTVQLVSNPSTGFLWKLGTPPYDESVLLMRGDKYIRPAENLCGAAGKRNLEFLAEGSGRTGLKLVYVRPWEKNQPPEKQFNLLVIVKDGTEADQKRGPEMRRNSKGELSPVRKRNLLE